MQRALRPSALIPPGITAERASTLGTVTTIAVVSASASSCCPVCGTASHRTHSRYVRKARAVPPDEFYPVRLLRPEDVHHARERVGAVLRVKGGDKPGHRTAGALRAGAE